jgi:Predicted methyltransferases
VPRRAVERRKRLQQIRWEQGTLIFLETPHRLLSTLADTVDVLGGERRCAIARELTKIHEDIYRGTVGKALDHFRESPPRGEIVLLIEGNRDRGVSEMDNIDNVDKRRVAEMLTLLQEAGLSRSQAARVVAQIMRIPKRLVYNVENEL